MSGGELLLFGLLVVTWGGMLWIYRHLTDAIQSQSEYRRERSESDQPGEADRSTLAAVSAEVTQVALHLQQAAHELSEALDVRTEKLKQLMAQTDARIIALVAETRAPAESDLASPTVSAESVAVPTPLVQPEMTDGSGTQGDASIDVRPRSSVEEIRRLAAEGLDPATIAERTHRGREEVRLLLQNLHAPRKGNKS